MAEDIPAFNEVFGRLHGKKAWRQNLNLAAISAAKVESSLGPKGAYKMVHYSRGPEHVVKVTKDAVEVLSELEIQYPALKALAEAARLHRENVGDGVSTMVIILAALLKEAEALMKAKVHPNVILQGYFLAATEASRVFDESALPTKVNEDDVLEMVDAGRNILTPGIRAALKEAAARAQKQGGVDLRRIRVLSKSGGSVSDSRLVRGVMVRKVKVHPSMPNELRDVKVALVNRTFNIKPLELLMKGTGHFKVKLNITNQGQIQRFKGEEARMNKELASAPLSAGAQVVVCRAQITDPIADEMCRLGLLAFELVDQEDMDAVAEATGATAIGDVKNLRPSDLGRANLVRTRWIEGIEYFEMDAEKGSTLILRGSNSEEIQELERVVKNAVRLLGGIRKDARAAWGGGATYMRAVTRLREYALDFPGKEQMAIFAFANALEQIPSALIRNFGLNYSEVLPELRSYHARGIHSIGIGPTGCVDMSEATREDGGGVRDLVLTNKYVLARVYEISKLLLRIDDYFYAKEVPLYHKK